MSSRIVFRYGENLDLCVLNQTRHFDKCWEWVNDPEVNRYMLLGVSPVSHEEERNFFESSAQNSSMVNFAVETKSGEYLGNVGLSQIDRQNGIAELGIMLGNKEFWGNGYGSEAERLTIEYGFYTLGLSKIYARVIAKNTGSVKAAIKAGMHQEATLKEHFFREGERLDVVILSIFNY